MYTLRQLGARSVPGVLAIVALLEAIDAVSLGFLAVLGAGHESEMQLDLLVLLLGPRMLFAMLGGVTLLGLRACQQWAGWAATTYLALAATQAAAGLFFLGGAGNVTAVRAGLTVLAGLGVAGGLLRAVGEPSVERVGA